MVLYPLSWFQQPKYAERFQVMSDLHLEVGQQYADFQIPVQAPYLILAGDIGRLCDYQSYLAFLTKQCAQFQSVFLVLGNHEFYGTSRVEGLRLAAKLESEPSLQGKMFVLNRRRVDVSNSVTLLGCTLQSQITEENRALVKSMISDFKHIANWIVDDHNAEHATDVQWLHEQVRDIQRENGKERNDRRRILVVTHHAPIRKGVSRPEHEKNPWTDAFATDVIDARWGLEDVRWWVFGHTHYTTMCKVGGVRLVSNQRGYVIPQSRDLTRNSPGTIAGKKRSLMDLSSWFRERSDHGTTEFEVRRCIEV